MSVQMAQHWILYELAFLFGHCSSGGFMVNLCLLSIFLFGCLTTRTAIGKSRFIAVIKDEKTWKVNSGDQLQLRISNNFWCLSPRVGFTLILEHHTIMPAILFQQLVRSGLATDVMWKEKYVLTHQCKQVKIEVILFAVQLLPH